jgi:hypothetical protein
LGRVNGCWFAVHRNVYSGVVLWIEVENAWTTLKAKFEDFIKWVRKNEEVL